MTPRRYVPAGFEAADFAIEIRKTRGANGRRDLSHGDDGHGVIGRVNKIVPGSRVRSFPYVREMVGLIIKFFVWSTCVLASAFVDELD